MSKTIKYTIQRNGIYYFNFRIDNLSSIFRSSLRTDSPRKSKILVNNILIEIQQLIYNGIEVTKHRLKDLINNIINHEVGHIITTTNSYLYPRSKKAEYVREMYNTTTSKIRDYNHSIDNEPVPYKQIPSFNDFICSKLTTHGFSQDRLSQILLNTQDKFEEEDQYSSEMSHFVQELTDVTNQGIKLSKHIKNDDKKLASDVLDMLTKSYQYEEKGEIQTKISKEVATVVENNSPTFSELKKLYIDQETKKKSEKKRDMEIFSLILGKYPINTVSWRELDNAMEIYSNLPKKQIPINKTPESGYIYKGLSAIQRIKISEESEVSEEFLQSKSTIQKGKQALQNFFSYCLKHRHINENPTIGMQFKISNSIEEKRGKFPDLHASNIIEHCLKDLENECHWAVLIMAFHGCRNGEVLQLRVIDIINDDDNGVNYLHITNAAGSIKTKNAKRKIPIHKKLIELGFLKFVSKKENNIFNIKGRDLTKWFKDIRFNLGIPITTQSGELLSLYSFRHNVRTKLEIAKTPASYCNAILGHSNSHVSSGYIHLELKELKAEIDKIEYKKN